MRIAGIVRESIVDGPGLRLAVFFQGCPHACKGCHNPDSHDFAGGEEKSKAEILKEFDRNPLLFGITLTGGEPFCQPAAAADLAKEIKSRGKNVITYTGYTAEELADLTAENPDAKELFDNSDYIIEGRFTEELRTLELRFRGSRNQRIIDVEKSKEEGKFIFCNL